MCFIICFLVIFKESDHLRSAIDPFPLYQCSKPLNLLSEYFLEDHYRMICFMNPSDPSVRFSRASIGIRLIRKWVSNR